MKNILILLSLLTIVHSTNAQYMNKKIISTDQGLPGTEVYNLTFGNDKAWFVAEGSNICSYNGFKTKCYDLSSIGLSLSLISLSFGYGLLHIYDTGRGKYYVFDGESFEEIKHAHMGENLSPKRLFIDSTGNLRQNLWNGQEFVKVKSNFNKKLKTEDLNNQAKNQYSIVDNLLLCNDHSSGQIIVSETTDSLDILLNAISLPRKIYKTTNGQLYHHSKNGTFKLNNNISILDVTGVITNEPELIIQNNDNYAIYNIQKDTIQAYKETFNLGFMTHNNKSYVEPSHKGLIINYRNIIFFDSNNNNMVNASHIVGEDNLGSIWFGGYKSGLSKYDENKLSKIPISYSRFDNTMTGRINSKDHGLIFITEDYNQLVSIKSEIVTKKRVAYENDLELTGYDIKNISDDLIGIGTFKGGLGLIKIDRLFKDTIDLIHKQEGLDFRSIFNIEEDNNKRIWMASQSEGIAVYDRLSQKAKTWNTKDNPNRFGVTSLLLDSLDNLWVGTPKGLYTVNEISNFDYNNQDFYDHLKKVNLNPLEGNTTSLIIYDSLLVATCEKSIYFINLNQYYQGGNFDAFTYSYQYDLQGSSSEENGMMIDSKKNLWVGTQEGYLKFNMPDITFDTTKIDVFLDQITIGDSIVQIKNSNIILPPDNRNFSYSYDIKDNPSLRNNIYIYSSIIANNNDTIFTELYNPIKSQNRFFLKPGHYKLVTETYKNNRLIDKDIYKLQAKAHLSENALFWPILIGILFLSFIYYQYKKNIQKKALLEKDLSLAIITQEKNQTQLQAIISSFNPHFINNSLHWAQSRYTEDENLVKVIGRLSENIQYIFSNTKSGNAVHALSDEIKLVDNYITIQKIRFKDSFDFIVENNYNDISIEQFKIPLMQLQIHVENAIEHGLRNRKESTFVKIEIIENSDSIHFKITDDGCGRPYAKSISSQGSQMGTLMLDKVHKIFNTNNTSQIKQWYDDNYFIGHGTCVNILIPKNYNYEI